MKSAPDAMVIGPQRAGTTWIHQYLENHPEVAVPMGVKETYFFDRRYHRGFEWYAAHFHSAGECHRIVEVAPSYFHNPEVPVRVRHDLGEIPLICTLRNPAERSFSLYLLLQSYGLTRGGFRDAIMQRPDILESSRYATHVRCWLDRFGRDRILFLFQESLEHEPDVYARTICRHLNISFVAVNDSLRQRVNRPSLPRSARLAKVAWVASDLARRAGAYRLIDVGKRLGLKTFLCGRPGSEKLPQLADTDREWVLGRLGDEISRLESLLQVDLAFGGRHLLTGVPHSVSCFTYFRPGKHLDVTETTRKPPSAG